MASLGVRRLVTPESYPTVRYIRAMTARTLLAFGLALTFAAPASAAPEPNVEVTATRVEIDQSPIVSTDYVFEVGGPVIKKEAQALLDAIAKALLKGDQNTKLSIDVYSDESAPDGDRSGAWLKKLTEQRAEAIKAYLGKKGVAARRLTTRGRGNESPIRDNATDEGRRANRRFELSIEIEVRPPVAADLATYLKSVRGNGPKLVATLDTSLGTLHCELYADRAPMAVANFVGLATGQKSYTDSKTGKVVRGKLFYDGLIFHRVIPGFMIQGGDPLGLGTGGPGYRFDDEIAQDLPHVPGTLAMANAGPRTNGSQFFIDEVRSPHLDNKHTVFGQCKEVDIVTKIGNAPRGPNDNPQPPVTIKRVTIAKTQ
jgi:cyclophilin family peptidyl-prolyl cis-trans isomerase/outer membrane protein OmpA-like peptidoglycan-associated protein